MKHPMRFIKREGKRYAVFEKVQHEHLLRLICICTKLKLLGCDGCIIILNISNKLDLHAYIFLDCIMVINI